MSYPITTSCVENCSPKCTGVATTLAIFFTTLTVLTSITGLICYYVTYDRIVFFVFLGLFISFGIISLIMYLFADERQIPTNRVHTPQDSDVETTSSEESV